MKNYDVVVVGTGAGAIVAEEAAGQGLKTALLDRGLLVGGTCPNWGCIPSKMLIYVADRILEIEQAGKLGVEAEVRNVDFPAIMERMRRNRQETEEHFREAIGRISNLDFYQGVGYFTGDYTLEVNGEELKGERIFIASGSRLLIPPIRGLEDVDYLTNESLLELEERPESLIIIGGGYVAVEFGHFLAAVGTNVTILEMADRLVLSEEPEVTDLLKSEMGQRMDIYTDAQAEEVKRGGEGVMVVIREGGTGRLKELTAQRLMVAVGRMSNADILKVKNTGVETDGRGFIRVNEYLETSREGIFAIGDANGQQMFRHMANREAEIVVQNAFYGEKIKVDYTVVPHAVYSYPQIASVGMGEARAREEYDVLVGRTKYFDVAKGKAMMESRGFAKVIIEKGSRRILGFHIIGPYAPELIQEVVNVMASGGGMAELGRGIRIHPALSELVAYTLAGVN